MTKMTHIDETLEHLLAGIGENEIVEFKQAKTSFDSNDLGQYFSALCNEANLKNTQRAWLVFGIKDNQTVIGSSYRNEHNKLMSLKEEVAKQTTGSITFTEIHVTEKEGKRIILFEIPAAPKGMPIAWKGHYYGRDHEALGALHENEREAIRSQSAYSDWSAGICAAASITDLDPEALALAKEKYAEKNPHLKEQIDSWDNATFLNKTRLTIEGQITRAALLLLGKPESSHHLSPGSSQITWILKDKDGIEIDYAHFHSPLLLAVDAVYQKIRKLTYRYMVNDSLFPDEVEQYAPYVIREALNNALAHQNYEKGGRVLVVENDNDSLLFVNEGSFMPGSVEAVIRADAPSTRYRNTLLVETMVNLKLIDTIGSGIKKMFSLQKAKFFPMPEYDFSNEKISVTIYGKILDLNYARKLVQMPDLTLEEIILLDKVQKKKDLTLEEAKELKKHNLIEGQKPNYYISAQVAAETEQAIEYMKLRGIDNEYLKKMILDALEKFHKLKRKQFEEMFASKLPEVLSDEQKSTKIKNVLQELRREGKIELLPGYEWSLKPSKTV